MSIGLQLILVILAVAQSKQSFFFSFLSYISMKMLLMVELPRGNSFLSKANTVP